MSGPQSERVIEATALIAKQSKCKLDDAFDLLRETAFALEQTLEFTALDVLDSLIRFDGA